MHSHRVAVVTGDTVGVGRHVCLNLASQGFDIAFTYHSNPQKAAALLQELDAAGRRYVIANPELSDPNACDEFVSDVESAFGW